MGSDENGEVDDKDHAEAEGVGIALELTGLEFAEKPAEAGGSAAHAADEQAIDEELIEEMDDGGEGVLEVTDEKVVVELVDVEAVLEQRNGKRVLFLA